MAGYVFSKTVDGEDRYFVAVEPNGMVVTSEHVSEAYHLGSYALAEEFSGVVRALRRNDWHIRMRRPGCTRVS